MGKHKQKSRKNPKRRAAEAKQQAGAEIVKIWFDEASSIPENLVLPSGATVGFIFTTEAEWVRETVKSYFKYGASEM